MAAKINSGTSIKDPEKRVINDLAVYNLSYNHYLIFIEVRGADAALLMIGMEACSFNTESSSAESLRKSRIRA